MKFKPVYLYGLIAVIAVAVLVVVEIQDRSDTDSLRDTDEQAMPDDDIHKQLKNQTSTSPGKENVSEDYRKKLAELEQAVNENPSDTTALKKYADYLTASHKMNEAIQYYEKILSVDPKRSDVRFSLAIIYFNKKDFDKCDDENEKILAYDPQNQMALYNLGAVAATRGIKEKAKDYWNKVILINSDTETARLARESLSKL